jgi:hypothetical protein
VESQRVKKERKMEHEKHCRLAANLQSAMALINRECAEEPQNIYEVHWVGVKLLDIISKLGANYSFDASRRKVNNPYEFKTAPTSELD